MLLLSRVYDFSSSHRLYREEWTPEENLRRFGKCATLHGHNYRMIVSVTGEVDPATQMIVDASLLDKIVNEAVFKDVDHKDLNRDVSWLEGALPTTEVLADACFRRITDALRSSVPQVMMKRLELWETRRICVVREA